MSITRSRGGCPPYLQDSKIKSHSLFRVNKISQDVKGLFLDIKFVSSRVISWLGCSSRTSCMSRWGVVLEYVRDLLDLDRWVTCLGVK